MEPQAVAGQNGGALCLLATGRIQGKACLRKQAEHSSTSDLPTGVFANSCVYITYTPHLHSYTHCIHPTYNTLTQYTSHIHPVTHSCIHHTHIPFRSHIHHTVTHCTDHICTHSHTYCIYHTYIIFTLIHTLYIIYTLYLYSCTHIHTVLKLI